MKKVLITVVLLLSAGCWASTPTVTQKAVVFANTVTAVSTPSETTITGRTEIAFCTSESTGTLSASDGTNTYTPVGISNTVSAGIPGSARAFIAKNITGVTGPISCSNTGTAGVMIIFWYEAAGASTTAPLDVPITSGASGITGSSSTPSWTLPTTTFANDLLLFNAICIATCSPGSGSANSQSDGDGTLSGLTTTTASLIFGVGYSNTTGTAVITVPLVTAVAYGVN